MSNESKVNLFRVEELIKQMNSLITELEREFNFKKIKSSKLQKWLNLVNDTNLSENDKFKHYFQITRYVRCLTFFKENHQKIKSETIKNILSGGGKPSNDKSEDFFFELDMARRFALRDDFKSIDLLRQTDVIFESSVNDTKIFIECKKIYSKNSFEDNIKKANEQLKKAIDKSIRKESFSIIALDLTEIFDKQEYFSLLQPIMENLIDKYKIFETETVELSNDNNFKQICSHLLQALMELKFHHIFKKFNHNNYIFHTSIVGIFYQVELLLPLDRLDKNNEFVIVRMATFYSLDLFPNLLSNNKIERHLQKN